MDSLITELTTTAPQQSANLRRNGKIARLPKETRDMINRMIDDGLPARIIIDQLGDAGEGLNAQNITNWKQGGYQDHLRTQERIERIRIQTETAIDILKGTADLDTDKIHEAARKAAAVQLFEAVWGLGPDGLLKLVQAKPARYLRLLNIICNFSNAALAREKFHWLMKQAEPAAAPAPAADSPETSRNPHPSPAPGIVAPLDPSSQFKVDQAPENVSNDSLCSTQCKFGGESAGFIPDSSPVSSSEGRAPASRTLLGSALPLTERRPASSYGTGATSSQFKPIQAPEIICHDHEP